MGVSLMPQVDATWMQHKPLFFVLHLAPLAKLRREAIAPNGHGRGVHARA